MVLRLRKSDQKDAFTFMNITLPGGTRSVHRAHLHQALAEKLGENTHLHLSTRVVGCRDYDDHVTLEFHDGNTASFDLVVGADGVKSVIRKEFLTAKFQSQEDCINPIWSGTTIYRTLITKESLEQQFPNHRSLTVPSLYCGKNKHITTYPISTGQLVNAVAFYSEPEKEGTPFPGGAVQEVPLAEVLAQFVGWEEEATALLKCFEKPTRWPILALKPLPSYGSGRMVLLGDAAHAMAVHLGAGAGQAMEDAYVLASILASGTKEGIDLARMIEVYNTVRQPMGNYVLNSSRRQGFYYEFSSPGMEDVQEHDSIPTARLAKHVEDIMRGFNWVWKTSMDDDMRRAMGLLL